ncbi:MAG: type 1 glutamine amidotransferase, partial [candidate division Zixibacteria bacterium]|nr:type 1 glutamine amidotransferase [candidate division Zixibacteria bacterium]
ENNVPFNVVRTYLGEALPRPTDIEATIVLGTPVSVRDYLQHEYLKRLFAFVAACVKHDLPLLGICFGGQFLARVLGADVTRNPVREIGIYRASLTDEGTKDKMFAGLPREIDVFHWHGDTFQIPFGATLLATGKTCRNQAFRKGNAVGIQFHIEPRTEEIPLWCDEYTQELAEEGKTKDQIVSSYATQANQMKQLSYRLMQNFLSK